MYIDPISVGMAGLSIFLDHRKQQAENAARQQNYLNQVGYQDATTEFNNWQAGFNARTADFNNQYSYWGETLNYNQQNIYSKQLTNYQFARELQQAQNVLENRVSAAQQYGLTQEALQASLMERGMQEAVALQQYQYRALQASAAFRASAQEGQSMDRYVRNFARQVGDANSISMINAGLRTKQYKRDQMAAITKFMSQYNSQNFYVKSPIQEPVMPFAPLPTMITPPGPTMRGAAPTSNGLLNAGTAVLGGVGTFLNTAQQVRNLGWGSK